MDDGYSRVALYTQYREGKTLTDISIFVDEAYRGQGVARLIIARLLVECDKEGFDTPYVYIDTDCSDGFWDHIGFEINPLCESPVDGMEYGYEKRISWEKLRQFAKLD
jgi:GNAT superfamily N-acetyltransferase